MRYCSLAGGEVTITRLGRSPSRRSPRAFVGQLKKRRELLTKYVPRWEPLDSWAFSSFFAKLDCLRSVAVGVAVFFFFVWQCSSDRPFYLRLRPSSSLFLVAVLLACFSPADGFNCRWCNRRLMVFAPLAAGISKSRSLCAYCELWQSDAPQTGEASDIKAL